MNNQPMCCPNPVHNSEEDYMAGMNIIPEPDKPLRWFCCDCQKVFIFKNGVSTLL